MSRPEEQDLSRPQMHPRAAAVLWFGTLGGVVAYALHLVVSFWLVPLACRIGTTAPLHAATLLLLVTAGASVWVAVRGRRRLRVRDTSPTVRAQPSSTATKLYTAAVLLRLRRLAVGALTLGAARPERGDRADPHAAGGEPEEPPHGSLPARQRQRSRFMFTAGLYLGILSLLAMVFAGAANFVFDPCSPPPSLAAPSRIV